MRRNRLIPVFLFLLLALAGCRPLAAQPPAEDPFAAPADPPPAQGATPPAAQPPGPPAQPPDQAAPVPQAAPGQVAGPAHPAQGPAPEVPQPLPFHNEQGAVKGWKVKLPGGRPLATPAVVDGVLYLGGGFGSHEFYALDAKTGTLRWQYRTGDDGPTAAVVQDGYVGFNTESCELELVTTEGKPVWKKWLGDPLMSMPAIGGGKIFMCYPDSRGGGQHHVACFELKTGRELWKRPVAGETITAPVLADGQVYVATVEGTVYCFQQDGGQLVWQERKNATSSPIVWKKQCYFSRREEVAQVRDGKKTKQQMENLSCRASEKGAAIVDLKGTLCPADYLDFSKRSALSPKEKSLQTADAGVGFGGGKGGAKIEQAMENVGQGSVCGVWSYQGSRPFIYKGRLYAAMGDTIRCVDLKTEKTLWKKSFHDEQAKKPGEVLDAVLTPPAIANGKLFLGTSAGELLVLAADTGETLQRFKLGESITFQPAVALGRAFASTTAGTVFCVETGDAADDGWLMWGGTAAHNGLQAESDTVAATDAR